MKNLIETIAKAVANKNRTEERNLLAELQANGQQLDKNTILDLFIAINKAAALGGGINTAYGFLRRHKIAFQKNTLEVGWDCKKSREEKYKLLDRKNVFHLYSYCVKCPNGHGANMLRCTELIIL